MAVGSQNNYPSLAQIADLARSLVNDDKAGATGTPGEGQILTNSSVTLRNLMNSAVRETCRDVRIMGGPSFIQDNYLLLGLPPVNGPLGAGSPDPTIQQSLQFTGFFDGLKFWPNFTLPAGMLAPLEMWERAAGTQTEFAEMHQSSGALQPREQQTWIGDWEWRTDSIWMNGATISRDIRLRCVTAIMDVASPSVDWTSTYVPILDSHEAIADKIVARYSARLGAAQQMYAIQRADRSILRLRQQVARQRQMVDLRIETYGGRAAGIAGNPAAFLY